VNKLHLSRECTQGSEESSLQKRSLRHLEMCTSESHPKKEMACIATGELDTLTFRENLLRDETAILIKGPWKDTTLERRERGDRA